jgi:hypothetical protein
MAVMFSLKYIREFVTSRRTRYQDPYSEKSRGEISGHPDWLKAKSRGYHTPPDLSSLTAALMTTTTTNLEEQEQWVKIQHKVCFVVCVAFEVPPNPSHRRLPTGATSASSRQESIYD